MHSRARLFRRNPQPFFTCAEERASHEALSRREGAADKRRGEWKTLQRRDVRDLAPAYHSVGNATPRIHADCEIGIRGGIVRTAVVAEHVQSLNGGLVLIEGLESFVDGDTVERAQRHAPQLRAIKRRLAHFGKTEGLLAKVIVALGVEQLVRSIDRLPKRCNVVKAQSIPKLFDGIRLYNQALLDQVVDLRASCLQSGSLPIAAFMQVDGRTAGGMETQNVACPPIIPHHVPCMIFERIGCMDNVIVGRRFVAESLTVQIHFKKWLAGQGKVIATGIGPVEFQVGSHQPTIEDHRRLHIVEPSPRPKTRLDTIPLWQGMWHGSTNR